MDIKPGDIVRLKSSARKMVVRSTNSSAGIVCDWIDDVGVPHQASYYPEMLMVTVNP